MPSSHSHKSPAHEDDRRLATARDIEIEKAHLLSPPFWDYMGEYFRENHKIVPSVNECITLYLDTDGLDCLLAGTSVRDRGGVYDQMSVKCRHQEFTDYAGHLTRQIYPDASSFMPYVRTEVEADHVRKRGLAKYTFDDFPEEIQTIILNRIGTRAKGMEYKPQVASRVPREHYLLNLDPEAKFNFILPPSALPTKRDNHVCIEVAMDKCFHIRPPRGMPIDALLDLSPKHDGKYKVTTLGVDHLLEDEFKAELSGKNLKDKDIIAAITRFELFLADLSVPFRTKEHPKPIRSVASKASRGYERLLTHFPKLAPAGISEIWKLAP